MRKTCVKVDPLTKISFTIFFPLQNIPDIPNPDFQNSFNPLPTPTNTTYKPLQHLPLVLFLFYARLCPPTGERKKPSPAPMVSPRLPYQVQTADMFPPTNNKKASLCPNLKSQTHKHHWQALLRHHQLSPKTASHRCHSYTDFLWVFFLQTWIFLYALDSFLVVGRFFSSFTAFFYFPSP